MGGWGNSGANGFKLNELRRRTPRVRIRRYRPPPDLSAARHSAGVATPSPLASQRLNSATVLAVQELENSAIETWPSPSRSLLVNENGRPSGSRSAGVRNR